MSDKHTATYHGISEEFPCPNCGHVYLSPRAAIMCEDRDLLEQHQAHRAPKKDHPKTIIRGID